MPLSISDLPRADGIVRGNFRARHKSKTFSLQGYGFRFVGGVTGSLKGRIADRLHAAYGQDVTFEPCDVDSALLALGWMRGRSQPEARVSRIEGLLEQLFAREAEENLDQGSDEGQPRGTESKEVAPQAPPPATTSPAKAPSRGAAPGVPEGATPEPSASRGGEEAPRAPERAKAAEATSSDPAPASEPARPTTPTELEALSEDALRALAANLGVKDKRWSMQRLQRFVADELGIGEQT